MSKCLHGNDNDNSDANATAIPRGIFPPKTAELMTTFVFFFFNNQLNRAVVWSFDMSACADRVG